MPTHPLSLSISPTPTPTPTTIKTIIRELQHNDIPACVDLLNKYLSFGRTTNDRLLKFMDNNEVTAHVLVQIGDDNNESDQQQPQKIIGFVKCQILPTLYNYPQPHPNPQDTTFPLTTILNELGYKPTAITFLSQQLTDPKSNLYNDVINLISLDLIVIDPEVRGSGYFHQLRRVCMDSFQPQSFVADNNSTLSTTSTQPSESGQPIRQEQPTTKFMIGYSWLRSESLGTQLARTSHATMIIPEYWLDENAPCDLCGTPCRCGVAVFIKS